MSESTAIRERKEGSKMQDGNGNGNGTRIGSRVTDLTDYDRFKELVLRAGQTPQSSLNCLLADVAEQSIGSVPEVRAAYDTHSRTARDRDDTGWLWKEKRPNHSGREGGEPVGRRKRVEGTRLYTLGQIGTLSQERDLRKSDRAVPKPQVLPTSGPEGISSGKRVGPKDSKPLETRFLSTSTNPSVPAVVGKLAVPVVPTVTSVTKQPEPSTPSLVKDSFPAGLPEERRKAYAALRTAATGEHPKGGWLVHRASGVLCEQFGTEGNTAFVWLRAHSWLVIMEGRQNCGGGPRTYWLRDALEPRLTTKGTRSASKASQERTQARKEDPAAADLLTEKLYEAYVALRAAAKEKHPEGGWLVRGACEVLCRQFGKKDGFSRFCSLKRAGLLTIQEGRHGRGGGPRTYWLRDALKPRPTAKRTGSVRTENRKVTHKGREEFPAGLPEERRKAYAALRTAATEEHPKGGWLVHRASGVLIREFGNQKVGCAQYQWFKYWSWLVPQERRKGGSPRVHWLRDMLPTKPRGSYTKAKKPTAGTDWQGRISAVTQELEACIQRASELLAALKLAGVPDSDKR